MFRKSIKNRFCMILVLFVFCFSSATIGSSLIYGSEVHFHQANVHVHHTDTDNDFGGSSHEDADTILYLDYVVANSTNQVSIYCCLNSISHTYNSTNYCPNLSNTFSRILHYSNKCSSCTLDLYQLKSSYLI